MLQLIYLRDNHILYWNNVSITHCQSSYSAPIKTIDIALKPIHVFQIVIRNPTSITTTLELVNAHEMPNASTYVAHKD